MPETDEDYKDDDYELDASNYASYVEDLKEIDYRYFMLTDSFIDNEQKQWVLIHWRPTVIQDYKVVYIRVTME
jgi:hypothetical protein